ncbi:MAG: sec-independent protein translocase protein TatC, partial [Gammaproteobacteria bacterium]
VITQVILFVAVYGLYEISILLVARVDRDREAKLREDGFYEDDEEAYDDVDDEDDAK